jgi:hypothetical protein
MAYSKFTLDSIAEKFGIDNQLCHIFVPPPIAITPSEWLLFSLAQGNELPARSEKSRSEFIVAPILLELRRINDNFFTVFSGEDLDADAKLGLRGECDFILAKDTGSFNIKVPIFQILEAKKNDVELGVAQCAAQMIGARIFNEKKNVILTKLYGCVTTGKEWLFICLEKNTLYIDKTTYNLSNLPELLGALQYIIDGYKT